MKTTTIKTATELIKGKTILAELRNQKNIMCTICDGTGLDPESLFVGQGCCQACDGNGEIKMEEIK